LPRKTLRGLSGFSKGTILAGINQTHAVGKLALLANLGPAEAQYSAPEFFDNRAAVR
jgi:hypothetical protein